MVYDDSAPIHRIQGFTEWFDKYFKGQNKLINSVCWSGIKNSKYYTDIVDDC